MNKYLKYLLFLSFVLFNACSNTKYLQKGQKLYTGGEIKIDDKNEDIEKKDTKAVKDELEDLLRPKPNSTILWMRVKLYIYNKTRTTKKKGLRHYIYTILGQPPVLISDVDVNKNSDILQNRLQN